MQHYLPTAAAAAAEGRSFRFPRRAERDYFVEHGARIVIVSHKIIL